MHSVDDHDVEGWIRDGGLAAISESLTADGAATFLRDAGVPMHIASVVAHARTHDQSDKLDDRFLHSISFYSLCRGFFLPISGLSADRVRNHFHIVVEKVLTAGEKELLLETFLAKEIGLSFTEKVACVLGDPFFGKRSTFKQDSLLRLLLGVSMTPRHRLLDRLAVVGDVAVLFAEETPVAKREPPLTSSEVIEALRVSVDVDRQTKFEIFRSLLTRCGRLEAYFLAKMILRRAGFGFDYQGPLLVRSLAAAFEQPVDDVANAMSLTDPFVVAETLEREGAAGLKRIRLRPLVAVRPALAANRIESEPKYPLFVERKYDGIRLLLHKSTSTTGGVLCGAYTRRRGDWLELLTGIEVGIRGLSAFDAIVDGELFGTTFDVTGPRPASVYEVYASLRGEKLFRIQLRYAAFDLLYVDGRDVTDEPLRVRRQMLTRVLGNLPSMPLPIPFTLSDGQMASTKEDVNRLYEHFRRQGYEGVITKDPNGTYALARRDPTWLKRKPAITLDLVLLGGVFSVTTKTSAGMFGSYLLGAKRDDGSFEDVGDVAGVDRIKDAEIQAEIAREGLLTGRRIERMSAQGARAGVEFSAHIVVTVRFEGIVQEGVANAVLRLRDPTIIAIRSDKGPRDADGVKAIEELYLKQRMG